MKRMLIVLLVSGAVVLPASGIELFCKHWNDHYLSDHPDQQFVKHARRAGCYICHVKGQDKHKVRNEYGRALARYLDADDFPKEWVEANPEKAKQKIIAAFKKVEQDLASDDREFGQRIDAGELPATDSGK